MAVSGPTLSTESPEKLEELIPQFSSSSVRNIKRLNWFTVYPALQISVEVTNNKFKQNENSSVDNGGIVEFSS